MQIEIAEDFVNPKDCQTIIVIQGSRLATIDELEGVLQELKDSKPIQGITIGADYTTQVITPIWNGKKY